MKYREDVGRDLAQTLLIYSEHSAFANVIFNFHFISQANANVLCEESRQCVSRATRLFYH